jgi:hypothetical protein
MPDFPEKAAMLRGARWGTPAVVSLALLSLAVMCLGANFGLAMAGIGLGKALFWTGFAVFMHRFRLESDGALVGGQYWLRYRRLGAEKWLEDWRARQPKVERYNRILAYWWPVLIALWLGIGAWGYWDFDRLITGMAADERLGATLQQELGDARIVHVVPMHSSFEGPIYPLHVNVATGTTALQGAQLAKRTRSLLAIRGEKDAWRIVVRPEYGHTLARVTYIPPGVTLPPGIGKPHPRPRKW